MFKDNFNVQSRRDLTEFTDETFTTGNRLKICIITEEIYGPIRNGGIATTYYYLASVLAEEGHNVTVLYLRGNHSENGSINEWIKFYKDRNIDFNILDDTCPIKQDSVDEFRLWKYSAVYYWLKNNKKFDIVHSSEWRGGAYFPLMAKQFGGLFENTLFITKSSSPWIWNRHYMNELIFNKDQVIFMNAEKSCIEKADIVIGGSAHLLSFMENAGYRIDPDRLFVQPNIISFSHLKITDSRSNVKEGLRLDATEWVFFGRLEVRKGLHLFCDAIDRLNNIGKVPEKITFMGKQGKGFPGYPKITAGEYLEIRTKNWKSKINIISDKQQNEAIQYLVNNNILAVMPSIIENSTMAVYETLIFKIPFIATSVGGTPELIKESEQDELLCEPTVRDLIKKLERSFNQGALIGHASFDPELNIKTWRKFHRWVTNSLESMSIEEISNKLTNKKNGSVESNKIISICLIINDEVTYKKLLSIIQEYKRVLNNNDKIVIGLIGNNCQKKEKELVKLFKQDGIEGINIFVNGAGSNIGACINCLCEESIGDWIIVNRLWDSEIKPELINLIKNHSDKTPYKVLTWSAEYSDNKNKQVRIPMSENDAGFLSDPLVLGGPDLAFKKEYWKKYQMLEDSNFAYPELEYLLRASKNGVLCALPEIYTTMTKELNIDTYIPYYLRRPIIESLPFGMKILLILRRLDPCFPDESIVIRSKLIVSTYRKVIDLYRRLKMKVTGVNPGFRK
jgi:glycosyltransferase involved in cell wall biosynthesis